LKPIAVELRLDEYFSIAVFSEPNIEIGYKRRGLRAEVCPVKTYQFLYRIGFLLYSQMKLALRRLGRSFKTITLSVIKPAMIRAGNAALFDATVTERSTAM
jgi:hypothetical protein